jgi:hypothetical protein
MSNTRYDALAETYRKCFHGEDDYMPLIAYCKCPGQPPREALVSEPETSVPQAVEALQPKVEIASDWIPSLNVGWFQCIAIPSLFGARTLENVEGSEPICKPRFTSACQAVEFGVPEVDGKMVDRTLESARRVARALPDDWHVSFPAAASPWDLGQILLGEAFLMELILAPDKSLEFLETLADLYVALNRRVLDVLAEEGKRYVTNRGIPFPGFRVPSDAIVNLSPELIEQFVLPVAERLRDGLGDLCLHYCTEPAPSGHVLPALLKTDAVLAVDNWQKPFVFMGEDAPARMQDRISIVGDMDLASEEKMDAFFEWEPVADVPRKGGRGIVMAGWAPSLEDAKRLYAYWREKQGR